MWITNGSQADWMCLLANTSEGAPHANKSLICLPMDTPGVQVSRTLDKLGMRSSDTAEIFFDNVRVPQKNLIGKEGYAVPSNVSFRSTHTHTHSVDLLSLTANTTSCNLAEDAPPRRHAPLAPDVSKRAVLVGVQTLAPCRHPGRDSCTRCSSSRRREFSALLLH